MPSLELTFDSLRRPLPAGTAAPQTPELVPLEQTRLTPEEQKILDEFIPKIELDNSNLILQYGSGAQKKIADFSENILGQVRTKDLGEVGEMLAGVVTGSRALMWRRKRCVFGFFKRSSTSHRHARAVR